MSDVQIECVTKSSATGGNDQITHVGGTGGGGWRWAVDSVVQSIDAGTNTFFVVDRRTGTRAEVGVVRPSARRPYIRTYANGVWNDNLLALGSCA